VCADVLPPNDRNFNGCDVKVNGDNFDAISDGQVLWEIKTNNLQNYSNEFVLMMMLIDERLTLGAERESAHACGYAFALGAGDLGFIAGVAPNYDWAEPAPPGSCIQPTNN
jgi:hypothetical protein